MENEKLFELMGKIYVEIQSVKIEMKDGFKSVNKDISELKKGQKSIEKTVLRIEKEHGEKLEALFDGYKQNTEQLTRIENQVSKHEEFILTRVK